MHSFNPPCNGSSFLTPLIEQQVIEVYLHVALRRCVGAQVEQFVEQLSVARLTVDSMLQQQFVQVYGARMV
jgi:hypothetical protein